MTEEEAKTKWCPFSRALLFDEERAVVAAGFNRTSTVDEDGYPSTCDCIGSACMAWRRFSMDDQTRGDPSKTGGYCGLAGKP